MFPISFSGGFSCLLIGILLLAAIFFVFITGATFVGTHLLPVFKILSLIGAAMAVLVYLPLSFSPKYRFRAGRWLTELSWIFSLTAWFTGVVAAHEAWGMTAVVIGVLLAGVGVIPVGMLAALWTGHTTLFGEILLWTTVAFLVHSAGNRLLLEYQAEQTRNAFSRMFYFRPGSQESSFFRTKKRASVDEEIIDAEYEIIEPAKKEIEPD